MLFIDDSIKKLWVSKQTFLRYYEKVTWEMFSENKTEISNETFLKIKNLLEKNWIYKKWNNKSWTTINSARNNKTSDLTEQEKKEIQEYIQKKFNHKEAQNELTFKENIDGDYTQRDSKFDEWPMIKILKNKNHPFYSIYAKNYPKEIDWHPKWYIEISSNRAFDLTQAKIIARKLYNIVIQYETPKPDNDYKKIIKVKKISSFDKRIEKPYTIRELDIEDEWTIRILKNEIHSFYSVYIKKYTFRFWIRTWYIEVSSSKAFDLEQAEIIANKLYYIATRYKAPSPGIE